MSSRPPSRSRESPEIREVLNLRWAVQYRPQFDARLKIDQGVRENLSVAQQDIALQGGVQTEPYLVVVILLAAGQSTCVAVGLS